MSFCSRKTKTGCGEAYIGAAEKRTITKTIIQTLY